MKQKYGKVLYFVIQKTERYRVYLLLCSEYGHFFPPTKVTGLCPVGEARTENKSLPECTESKSNTRGNLLSG
jgi:hypothetical protein